MRSYCLSLSIALLLSSTAVLVSISPVFAGDSSAKKAKSAKHGLSGKEALNIVEALPEVKAFRRDAAKGEAKKRGVTTSVDLDREESGEYIIHVYEDVPDDKETSHTATFNWYHVNKKTGAVKKEF